MQEEKKRRKVSGSSIKKEDEESSRIVSPKKQKVVSKPMEEDDTPKSKKELRKERKAALKVEKLETRDLAATDNESAISSTAGRQRGLSTAAYLKQKQQLRRKKERLERKLRKESKERAQEERFCEQNRLRQELKVAQEKANKQKTANSTNKKRKRGQSEEHVDDLAVLKSLFKETTDPTTGATICRLGVQYVDIKIGSGPIIHANSLVTVQYQLRGGSPNGTLLDSSKKFTFRIGKGEVIQGWDIGLKGMKLGGVRNLIVPPKAGYGSQDIGAGAGAMLYFKVSLLGVR